MSSARFEHFIFGIALWVAYLYLKRQRGDGLLLHPVALAVTVPVLYVGTALPDWDITVFGIGGHRNPLFHSSIPYFAWPGCGASWDLQKLYTTSVDRALASPSMSV